MFKLFYFPTIVPLGGGCDTGIILNRLKLRKQALPFDWLWNLDTGLDSVTDIIDSNFKHVIDSDSYEYRNHYRLDKLQIVYKNYPSIIHMHSNPFLQSGHSALVRRYSRFHQLLKSSQYIRFIYYVNHEEFLLKNPHQTIRATVSQTFASVLRFLSCIQSTYGLYNFTFLCIIQ